MSKHMTHKRRNAASDLRQERSFIDNHHLRSKYFRTCDQGVEPPLDDGNESSDDFRCTPRQRTSSASAAMSEKCQKPTFERAFAGVADAFWPAYS
jgi:hypothetical protein